MGFLYVYAILVGITALFPFFTLFVESRWLQIVSTALIFTYLFVLYLSSFEGSRAFWFLPFMVLGPFAGVFAIVNRALLGSVSGVASLIGAILIATWVFRKIPKSEGSAVIPASISASIFYLSLFILANVMVPIQLRVTSWLQFGKNQCELSAVSPLKMLQYGSTDFPLSHATILTSSGGYNWSFRQSKWTPDMYTGASSGDEFAIARKRAMDLKAYQECVSKRKQ